LGCTYCKLCQFYNAAGFADLIIRARIALKENPQLNDHDFFIVDEYQDFNLAEEALILQLVKKSKGLLIAGDDDQVLYEFKSGKASIRDLYKSQKDTAKAMLPFCTRGSYNITKCGAYFIDRNSDSDRIEKIHLPLCTNQDTPKVQIIACATPSTAVDYIEKFVADNKNEIDERKVKLLKGEPEDAYLLILTPAREVKFYGRSKAKLKQIVSNYKTESRSFEDYYSTVLNYYSLSKNPENNFTFRKILLYEDFTEEQVHPWIVEAMQNNKNFCDLTNKEIRNILGKCDNIKNILDAKNSIDETIDNLLTHIPKIDRAILKNDLEQHAINQDEITKVEQAEDEEAELEEVESKKICAVDLITIVGSKGLSADHVMLIGFDNVNMTRVTKNAFYVAMTRARKSLHIITALQSGGATKEHGFLHHLPEAFVEFHKHRKTYHLTEPLEGKKGFVDYIESLNSKSTKKKL
jgi:superfamily I DNA/RNA helicase